MKDAAVFQKGWGVDMNSITEAKILVIDDDAGTRRVTEAILQAQGFGFLEAADGKAGIEIAKEAVPDLILLDINMPGMNGFETCLRLKEDVATRNIPVVILTARKEREVRLKTLQVGASDFLEKPLDVTELLVRVNNLLKAKKYQDALEHNSKALELQVADRTRQLKEALIDTMHRLSLATEYRDEDTYLHVKRISYYTDLVARRLGVPAKEAEIMYYASPMHDIGKVGIPDSILLKPTGLTPREFEVMKTHTTIGARILRGSDSPYLKSAEKFALCHHERWDGLGYPQGLKGKEIPLEGRILNIIDQYDSLRSNRPYKPPFDHETAVRILTKGGPDSRTTPAHFDPEILEIFRKTQSEFRDIYEANSE